MWRRGGVEEGRRGGVEEGRRHGCAPILLLLARRRLQRERASGVERRRLGALLGAARDGRRLLPRVLRGRSATRHGRVVDMSCTPPPTSVLRRVAEPRQGSISAHLDLSPLLHIPLSAHLRRVCTSDGWSMSDADEASEKSSYRKAPRGFVDGCRRDAGRARKSFRDGRRGGGVRLLNGILLLIN